MNRFQKYIYQLAVISIICFGASSVFASRAYYRHVANIRRELNDLKNTPLTDFAAIQRKTENVSRLLSGPVPARDEEECDWHAPRWSPDSCYNVPEGLDSVIRDFNRFIGYLNEEIKKQNEAAEAAAKERNAAVEFYNQQVAFYEAQVDFFEKQTAGDNISPTELFDKDLPNRFAQVKSKLEAARQKFASLQMQDGVSAANSYLDAVAKLLAKFPKMKAEEEAIDFFNKQLDVYKKYFELWEKKEAAREDNDAVGYFRNMKECLPLFVQIRGQMDWAKKKFQDINHENGVKAAESYIANLVKIINSFNSQIQKQINDSIVALSDLKTEILKVLSQGPEYFLQRLAYLRLEAKLEAFSIHANILDLFGRLDPADRQILRTLASDDFEQKADDLFDLFNSDGTLTKVLENVAPGAADALKQHRSAMGEPRATQIQPESQSIFQRVGDPVDVASGAFCIDSVDIRVLGEPTIELKRSYNSLSTEFGDFGAGWTHSYPTILHASAQDGVDCLHAADTDGSIIIYSKKDGEAVWRLDLERNPWLDVSKKPGWNTSFIEEINDQETKVFKHHLSNGGIKIYTAKQFGSEQPLLYLDKWVDAYGKELIFQYGEKAPYASFGQLTQVSNSTGQYLQFSYNLAGYIRNVTSSDDRSVEYSYDDQWNLKGVQFPDKTEAYYTYFSKEDGVNVAHLIKQKKEPGSSLIENAYDENGRVTAQKTPYKEEETLEDNMRFEYSSGEETNGDFAVTHVYDPENGLTKYYFFRNKIYRIVDALGNVITNTWYITENEVFNPDREVLEPATAPGLPFLLRETCSKRGVITRYTYNENGNVLECTTQGEDLTGSGLKEKTQRFSYEQAAPFRLIEEWFFDEQGIKHSKRYVYDPAAQLPDPTQILHYVGERLVKRALLEYGTDAMTKDKVTSSSIYNGNETLLSQTIYKYNRKGQLWQKHEIIDSTCRKLTTTYHYNDLGQLSSEKTPYGASIDYEYDEAGRLEKRNVYEDLRHLFSEESTAYQDGKVFLQTGPHPDAATIYQYDASANLSSVITSEGETRFHNDKIGNVLEETDPLGYKTLYQYDALGRQTGKYRGGRSYTYAYEPEGVISSEQTNWGSEHSYTYTTDGLLLTHTYPNGFVERLKYDCQGRVIYHETQEGLFEYQYDDATGTVTTTHNGRTETKVYDALGRLLKTTGNNGSVQSYEYNYLGEVVSFTNPEGEVHKFDYDYSHSYAYRINQVRETLPSGDVIVTNKDNLNRVVSRIYMSQNGEIIEKCEYSYMEGGKVVIEYHGGKANGKFFRPKLINKDGKITHSQSLSDATTVQGEEFFEYDANGNLISYTDVNGKTYTYEYDEHGQCTEKTRPDGSVIKHEYDIAGNRLATSFPKDVKQVNEYDIRTGEKQAEKLIFDGQEGRNYTYAYDPKGRMVEYTDPRGIVFTKTYDLADRLSSIEASTGDAIRYEYNENGLPVVIEKTSPSEASIVIDRSYNSSGQIEKETIRVGEDVHQQIAQSWARGRRTGLLLEAAGKRHALSFRYNAASRLAEVSCPLLGYAHSYYYDEAGRILLDGCSRLTKVYAMNGELPATVSTITGGRVLMEENLSYDGNKKIVNHSTQVNFEDSTEYSLVYDYDEAGNLVGQTYFSKEGDLFYEKSFSTYDVDELGILQGRMICSSDECTHHSVAYQSGNQPVFDRFFDETGSDTCYISPLVDGLELFLLQLQKKCPKSSSEDRINAYDREGNLTSVHNNANNEHLTLTWNVWGELVQVESSAGYAWKAVYDGVGRRIWTIYDKNDGSEPICTKSYYDPLVEFLEIGVSIGDSTSWKIYGADEQGVYGGKQGLRGFLATIDEKTNETYVAIQDAQGHIIGYIAGEETALATENAINAYGEAQTPILEDILGSNGEEIIECIDEECSSSNLTLAESLVNAHIWRGKRLDPHGFIYFGTRYYDPNTGRFISPDPLGHDGSISLYSYTEGDPVNYYDSDGRYMSAVYEGMQNTPVVSNSISMGLDFVPGVSNFKSLVEAISGKDYVTGAELTKLERWLSAFGAVAPGVKAAVGLIKGGGKGLAKLGTVGAIVTDHAVDINQHVENVSMISGKGKMPVNAENISKIGRSGKQAKLRNLASDPNISSADKGWIQQEIHAIQRGKRTNIRVPIGKNLAHKRGFEAKKGYGYEHSDLQDIIIHKLQHKHEGY